VSFLVKPDGTVETDSVDDALKLQDAILRRREARRQLPESDDLPANAKKFLIEVGANPSGLTSEEISKRTGIPTKSVPPLIRGLTYWATRNGFALDKLLTRKQSFDKGRPISTYTLTAEGRRKFQKFLKPAVGRIKNRASENILDIDPFEKKRGTPVLKELDELFAKAAKSKNIAWYKNHDGFTCDCPGSLGTPHRLAVLGDINGSIKRMKCLGHPACPDELIAKFFAKKGDE